MKAKIITLSILSTLILSQVNSVSAETAQEAENQKALLVLMGDFEQTERSLKNEPGSLTPGSKYTLKAGDTLHDLAISSYGNTPLNMEIVEKIIVKKNPNGFFRGNGDYVLVGEIINIPSVDDIRDYVFSYSHGKKYNHISEENWIRYPN